jgi:ATP-dependent protease ClpP protease subunit
MTRPRTGSRASRLTQALAALVPLSTAGVHLALAEGDGAEPAAGSTAELWLYGIVGGYWFGFNAKSVADQLRGLDVDNITVRIHSPGGSIGDGIAISNLLRNHKARVTVVVDGLAASIASVIAVAGDEVVMSPGSQLMLHDGWMITLGNERELRQDADFIGKQSANMAEIYAYATSASAEAWRAAMTADPDGTWYTADEAVKAGLATRVGTVVATSAAPEPPAEDEFEDDEELAARAALDLDVLISPAACAVWSYADRAPKPPTASAGGSTETEGGTAVSFTDEQLTTMRETLGLAESADEAAIVAAINAVVEESLEERPPAALAAPTPAVAALPDGVVAIDADVLAQLQAGATAGAAAAERQRVADRDAAISAAFRAGKITANTRANWTEQWDKNPTGTQALLDALPSGLVPTAEVGHESEPNALGEGIEISDAELDAFAGSLGLTKEALRG